MRDDIKRKLRADFFDEEYWERGGGDKAGYAGLTTLEGMNRDMAAQFVPAFGLSQDTKVLDLGCGAGIPATSDLAKHFVVTGVDISARMIALARDNVPSAKFIQADMTEIDFMPNSFDAAISFYSMIHVPRDKQQRLLNNIASWLRPGGFFVATMGASSAQMILEKDWMGVPMFWSIYGTETNLRLIREAGLEIMSAKKVREIILGQRVTFLWITAQKPS